MKISKNRIKQLINESIRKILKENETGNDGFVDPDIGRFDIPMAEKTKKMFDDLAFDLQTAMYGMGNDSNTFSSINKNYITGIGTNVSKIKDVFNKIVNFSKSSEALNYNKKPFNGIEWQKENGRDPLADGIYDFTSPKECLKYLNDNIFETWNKNSLKEAFLDELSESEISDLNMIIPDFLNYDI